ncbi:UDP-glucosyltransferase 2-like isoform X2 [Planococcus citri]|uniref:UDP-glucosyltransferase 2-like isoform X2 n=1 Tax=Planococcus citri TaxID=170843 RepID=UPI0031F8E204
MRFNFVYLLCALTLQSHFSEGAKILGIFLVEAQSHFSYNNAVMRSLIEVGHAVTIITPFPDQAASENYTSIIDVSPKEKRFVGTSTPDEYVMQNVMKFMDLMIESDVPYCNKIINLPEIQKILKSNEKLYDVVFVEISFLYKCFLPVAEKMKVPIIGTIAIRTWLYADYVMNNPNHPAYIPNELTVHKWKLSHVFGRIINVWNHIAVAWYTNFIVPPLIESFHTNHADKLQSLGKYKHMEPDLIFYNNHESILPKPSNPNVINVAGIHVKDSKPLPKHIQKFIDEAKHGVILFTFGSVVRATTMSSEMKNAFRDAFAEIPQRVIWKFEAELENTPDNVMLIDWLPQRDILKHENVIAFISHCGLGATNEALYTATPVIACPLFCDQPDNAELLENLGVAVHLDFHDITKESVLKALKQITNDKRYYNNMQRVSAVFKDRPMTPQESVVYWTEYVIRNNGASHFKTPASRLYLFQYLLLDVVFIVVLFLGIVLYLINRIFKSFCYYFNPSNTGKTSNKPQSKKL